MKLVELASVIRTKNAGPFELTIDVIFNDRKTYQLAKKNNILNASLITMSFCIAEA
jgi:hypothetical protein